MNFSVLFQSSLIPLLLITFFLSINFQLSVCADTAEYGNCSLPITCGSVKSNISYPFWGGNRPYYCGKSGFEVTCDGTVPLITMRDINFRILDMKNISSTTSPTVKVARDDYWETICPSTYVATNLNLSLFSYSSDSLNVSFWYSCNTSISALGNSRACNNTVTVSYLTAAKANVITTDPVSSGACKAEVLVPVSQSSSVALDSEKIDIETAIDGGFELDVLNADPALCSSCLASGGACGANSTGANEFMCFCQTTSSLTQICTQSSSTVPTPAPPGSPGPKFNWKLKIVLGVCSVVGSILFVVTGFGVIRSVSVYKEANSEDVEAFIQNIGPLAVKRYKFSDVRKMTNSFKDKLGHGGYGDVYEGKLLNGCPVAVKVLKESKGNGEDFVNEVASISRTSHVNVVTLLGYCFEGKKKALIYEFMPNGSLEKFIYKDTDPLKTTPHMELEKLLQIAIGIARGLEYLHRGCNTRILHFDIKPHNILLDENFCPKISDFGLSKLCTRKESIISMLDARGTIGYIAPEVFCRNFGGVSVKSDVYSYGMMILEMVGGRKNIDARVSHTSEIYFPDWVYENLEQGSNFGLVNAVTEEEKEIARKMILVGLWCIQTRPSDRPSMSKVIEMLEGSIEALQTPPKPVLSSPVRSSTPKSTTLSTIS